jgi:hypothetical protein
MNRLFHTISHVVFAPYLSVYPVTVARARLPGNSRLRIWVATFGLWSSVFLAASMAVHAQFKQIGPAPISPAVARQQIRTLLEKVDPGNSQQTLKTLSDLTPWYRDLLDEELIAAWRKDTRANLTEVMEPLADPRVAAEVVEFSWRQQRQATFTPAYAPMLGRLMARYGDSAKPFLDDLLVSIATAPQALELSKPEAEAVCRILLDMPDIRTWRQSALRILPHYRRDAQDLLNRDLQGDDLEKMYRATRWLSDLAAADRAFDAPRRTAAATPPRLQPAPAAARNVPDGRSAACVAPPPGQAGSAGVCQDAAAGGVAGTAANAPGKRSVPNTPDTPQRSTQAHGGVFLIPLDPAMVDDKLRSTDSGAAARIAFVNRSSGAVDIYRIDRRGDRVLYRKDLAAGATYSVSTGLKNFWLVVVSGTGGTTAQDTGSRLAGFEAVTPNRTGDPAIRDTAIITDAGGALNAPRSRPGDEASGS